MLHSAFSYEFLKRQRLKTIKRLLLKLLEEKHKERAFRIWLNRLPQMTKKDFIRDFDEHWERRTKKGNVTNKSKGEILAEVEDILKQFRGGEKVGTI